MKKKRSVLFDNEIRLLMHKLLPRKRKGVELLLQNPIVFSRQTGIPTPLEYLKTHFDDYGYFSYRQIMDIINIANNLSVVRQRNRHPQTRIRQIKQRLHSVPEKIIQKLLGDSV